MKKIFSAVATCFLVSTALADQTNLINLSEADNSFAFDLLRQIDSAQPAQNIFISPYSAATALEMLDNGATGKTKTEIEHVLKTDRFPTNTLNQSALELTQSLHSLSGVGLELADSIWFDTGIQLKPAFVIANKDFYESELSSVNFETPEAADTINQWADKSTHGKIKDIVSFPFPAATQMILASAIYFKAKWTDPFDKDRTQPRNFYLSDGMVKMTQMMSQRKSFCYRETPDFQEITLTYAGAQLNMTIFLPATNSSPQKLLAHFTGAHWGHELRNGTTLRDGTVILPKFKLDYDITLNSALQALGMRQAFIPSSANFSNITGESLNISEVAQKSYVNVDEEGTEAAAITTVWAVNSLAIRGPPPFQMLINRPFFFMISDGNTGTILFAGIINDPTLH